MAIGVTALWDDRYCRVSGYPKKCIRHGPVLGGWLGSRLIALGRDVRGNGRLAQ